MARMQVVARDTRINIGLAKIGDKDSHSLRQLFYGVLRQGGLIFLPLVAITATLWLREWAQGIRSRPDAESTPADREE
jgi:hypothetical protein